MKKNWSFIVLFIFGFIFTANLFPQNFGANNSIRLQRKVVSFMIGDNDHKDVIDRVELNWSKAVENWVPQNLLRYRDEQGDGKEYDMHDYIQGQLSKRSYYNLRITFFYKDGTIGSLTLFGGTTGDSESLWGDSKFGESMHWYFRYPNGIAGVNYSGRGSLYAWDGDLFWSVNNNNINVGFGADIVTGDEWKWWVQEGDRRKNTIIFENFEQRLVLLELDGSFFP